MTARCPHLRSIVALALLATFAAGTPAQSGTAEERGRALYRNGTHADGRPLAAVSGANALPLPAAFVACVNCHGPAGRGRTEGGVATSDIRWDTLGKPYDLVVAGGRRRAPYDAALFFRAITQGMDSSGNPLDPIMPRYQISAAESAELLAGLAEAEHPADEGVLDDAIRIGCVLAPTAGSDRRLLATWIERQNIKGGIFRRRLELVPFNFAAQNTAPPVLAVLAGEDLTQADARACETRGIPTLQVAAGEPSRYRFSLCASTADRACALMRYAVAHRPSGALTIALLHNESRPAPAELAAVVAATQTLAAVQIVPLSLENSAAMAKALHQAGVENILLLGPDRDFSGFLASARRDEWKPLLLWIDPPAATVTATPAVCVQSALSSDISPEALAEYLACTGAAPVTDRERSRQLALLATAQLLVTALENSGREISREKLVGTLEALGEFRSPFFPPGTFSPRRHTAASGVYVVPLTVSPASATPEWVTFE